MIINYFMIKKNKNLTMPKEKYQRGNIFKVAGSTVLFYGIIINWPVNAKINQTALAKKLGCTPVALSYHFKILKDAGLISKKNMMTVTEKKKLFEYFIDFLCEKQRHNFRLNYFGKVIYFDNLENIDKIKRRVIKALSPIQAILTKNLQNVIANYAKFYQDLPQNMSFIDLFEHFRNVSVTALKLYMTKEQNIILGDLQLALISYIDLCVTPSPLDNNLSFHQDLWEIDEKKNNQENIIL